MNQIFNDPDRSRTRRSLPLLLCAALLWGTVSGCAQSSSPEAYNGTREWSGCAVIGAFTGALVGAGLGIGIQEAVQSSHKTTATAFACPNGGILNLSNLTCNLVGVPGQFVPIKTTESTSDAKQSQWIGAVAAIPGAIIGAFVGHYVCDPIFQSPYHGAYGAPPPPPPSDSGGAPSPTSSDSGTTPATTSQNNAPPTQTASAGRPGQAR